MEDFLKDRPVLDPKSALVRAADPKLPTAAIKSSAHPAPAPSGATSPFGDLRRDPVPATPGAPARPTVGGSGAAEVQMAAPALPQNLKGEHGTKVQTIVERGRVVKLIVTCTCGKVTEIACQY